MAKSLNPDIRTVLITGASGGIGSAAVDVFAEAGWRVIGVDLDTYTRDFPENGLFIQGDISVPEELANIFEQIREFTNRLDALINNAAVQVAKPFLETTLNDWDDLMNVNMRAVFFGIQKAYALLKQAEGAIVNVSSVHAVATSTQISTYAASKGGILALTRALAVEFAPDNIRVNAILPGAVVTPMLLEGLERGHLGKGTTDARMAELAKKTVLGRIGKPEEIAQAIYFLADNNQSSFMTGQSMVIDGGATARLSTE
ncbi:MAG: SDR family oxidoreductase [Chloroflexi bacterium]|nr:SDR family oxidoreductase [Chloroflexota bacterium]